jgi:hypothetical protein
LELKLNCQNQTDPLVASFLVINLELVQKLEDLYSLLIYMYVPSSFGMKNKQYYVDGLKEHFVLLNFKAPQRLQLYSIERQHFISCTFTFSLVARCQELMAKPFPNFLQGFIKCHFISTPLIKHKPLRPQISQQTLATHKVHS